MPTLNQRRRLYALVRNRAKTGNGFFSKPVTSP